jgi:hypothetical protein
MGAHVKASRVGGAFARTSQRSTTATHVLISSPIDKSAIQLLQGHCSEKPVVWPCHWYAVARRTLVELVGGAFACCAGSQEQS